jgi:hypothetical protein
MTRKTSISLSDEDDRLLHEHLAAGGTLREIIKRGLGTERPDMALAREAAAAFYSAIDGELQDRIDRAVERALRKMQGG